VLELAGVRDVLTKCYGSTNSINLVKATIVALGALRTKEEIAELRGVEL
jgi:small subunit ribosomal protein S5